MKEAIFTFILVVFGLQVWAGHYSVTVDNAGQGTRIFSNYPEDGNFTYTCKGECEGKLNETVNMKPGQQYADFQKRIKEKNAKYISEGKGEDTGGLKYQKSNEYISETGQVHLISELLIKYETVLLNVKEASFELSGTQDLDVIYVLSKKGNSYTIDIYTGADAHKMNNTQNTK